MKLANIDKAFEVWRERGLLSDAQVEELRDALEESQSSSRGIRAVVLFSTLGAILVGLGVILFVASHWETMGPLARSATMLAAYAATCAAAFATEKRALPLVAESLWFLATLVLGANIFIIGQIFNFTLTFWQGPFLWAVGAIAMGAARQKASYGWLAVPLGLLALGWLGGGSGWFFDDQVEFLSSDRGLTPLLPTIGLALLCAAGLLRNSATWTFLRPGCAIWGLVLVALPLVAGTADDSVVKQLYRMAFTTKQLAILAASALAVALFALRGKGSTRSAIGAGALLLTFAALVVPHADNPAIGAAIADSDALFAIYVVITFATAMGAVWLGLVERSSALINFGLLSAAAIIVIQYFSWTFELLDRSIAFIVGGLLLLAIGYRFERARRYLLARIEAGEPT